jgi:hypothetical protein
VSVDTGRADLYQHIVSRKLRHRALGALQDLRPTGPSHLVSPHARVNVASHHMLIPRAQPYEAEGSVNRCLRHLRGVADPSHLTVRAVDVQSIYRTNEM